jgi:hypothetical protein
MTADNAAGRQIVCCHKLGLRAIALALRAPLQKNQNQICCSGSVSGRLLTTRETWQGE